MALKLADEKSAKEVMEEYMTRVATSIAREIIYVRYYGKGTLDGEYQIIHSSGSSDTLKCAG